MASYNIPAIHGRSSYSARIRIVFNSEELNFGSDTVFLEIPGATPSIRLPLEADTDDADLKLLRLSRAQVEALPTSPTPYCVVDETNPDFPVVVLDGTIARTGYVGAPA